ncbi:GNAT family N-acetyltransferase [Anaerobacillus sp. MEB173]|uniref:GNAT family N-acetyltransferase n=1 Tax=Anaerobacillus sp. MEB173 TaxID=3383345 RepID=UPI003F9399C6
MTLRTVHYNDLEQLLSIENEGFSKEEAATEQAFIERIRLIPDTFIVAEKRGEIIGYVNGPVIHEPYITDDLFEKINKNPAKGGFQSILGLAVSKENRYQGVARILLEKMTELVKVNQREGITLTCKQELVPFYEKLGFSNHGVSESQHGGFRWYNMVKINEFATNRHKS